MMPRLRAFLFTAAFVVPTAAAALAPPITAPPPSGDTHFVFELDTVDVVPLVPAVTLIDVFGGRQQKSLIRLRADFVKEVVRSADDI